MTPAQTAERVALTCHVEQSKRLTVAVLQKHIDEGVQKDCQACPFALALNEQHAGEGQFWKVGNGGARRITLPDYEVECFLFTKEKDAWIYVFDHAGKERVRPTTFELVETVPGLGTVGSDAVATELRCQLEWSWCWVW